jgi:hypothetical protein
MKKPKQKAEKWGEFKVTLKLVCEHCLGDDGVRFVSVSCFDASEVGHM